VLFDPQCPHCGHLWQSSQPLLTKVKFVWVPIAFNQGKSLTQATVLLSASDPATTMSEHEKLLLAGQGGIAAPTTPDPQRVKEVQSNTELLNLLGADAVPYILAKNRKTGALIAQSGAMGTPELAALLGID
jgi:thiol:disulfide interchange protein DsbG